MKQELKEVSDKNNPQVVAHLILTAENGEDQDFLLRLGNLKSTCGGWFAHGSDADSIKQTSATIPLYSQDEVTIHCIGPIK